MEPSWRAKRGSACWRPIWAIGCGWCPTTCPTPSAGGSPRRTSRWPEWVVLRTLYPADSVTPSRVADELKMTRGAISSWWTVSSPRISSRGPSRKGTAAGRTSRSGRRAARWSRASPRWRRERQGILRPALGRRTRRARAHPQEDRSAARDRNRAGRLTGPIEGEGNGRQNRAPLSRSAPNCRGGDGQIPGDRRPADGRPASNAITPISGGAKRPITCRTAIRMSPRRRRLKSPFADVFDPAAVAAAVRASQGQRDRLFRIPCPHRGRGMHRVHRIHRGAARALYRAQRRSLHRIFSVGGVTADRKTKSPAVGAAGDSVCAPEGAPRRRSYILMLNRAYHSAGGAIGAVDEAGAVIDAADLDEALVGEVRAAHSERVLVLVEAEADRCVEDIFRRTLQERRCSSCRYTSKRYGCRTAEPRSPVRCPDRDPIPG